MPETLIERKKVDQSFERRMLIGMIISNKYLREMKSLYKPQYASANVVNLIANWCLDFYDKYDKAPSVDVQDFLTSPEIKDDESASVFSEKLLDSLSEEYERGDKFNADYLIDETEKSFKIKSIKLYAKDLTDLASNGDIDSAQSLVGKYSVPERLVSAGVDPFGNEERIKSAFENEDEILFKMPGALGDMMNPQLVRSGFIGIMAPEKRGKSFWCREFGIRALRSRCNVAYFDTGDMSEQDIICQLHSNISGRPLKSHSFDKPVSVPTLDCKWNQDDVCEREERLSKVSLSADGALIDQQEAELRGYKPCSSCKFISGAVYYQQKSFIPLTWQEAVLNGKSLLGRSKGRRFKLSTHNNSMLTVKGLDNILENWKNSDDFVPDVIIVDYADIMAPDDTKDDPRQRENSRWKKLRALSQKWHALVITATQTDAGSYETDIISLRNFTEDKRKYGHVTAMYALNQTDDERDLGVLRFGELLVRKGSFDRKKIVNVLECRHIGRPYVGSYFG